MAAPITYQYRSNYNTFVTNYNITGVQTRLWYPREWFRFVRLKKLISVYGCYSSRLAITQMASVTDRQIAKEFW